jgi:hypothetical protein
VTPCTPVSEYEHTASTCTLNMEIVCSSEMSVFTYEATKWRHPKNPNSRFRNLGSSTRLFQSSPARMLGSWFRIPLETWMSVCAVLFVESVRRANPSFNESYQLCRGLRNWKAARDQRRAVELLMYEWFNLFMCFMIVFN